MKKKVSILIYLSILCLSHAEETGANNGNAIIDAAKNIDPAIETAVRAISDAGHKTQNDILRNAISDEYLGTIQKFDAFFKKKASIAQDYDFYTIVSINRIVIRDQVAFVEATVAFNPAFLLKHQNAITGNMGASIWTNTGGYGLANKFETGGTGRVTYYLVKQHGFWKLHYSYFSSKPLSDGELAIANDQMKTLVHPN